MTICIFLDCITIQKFCITPYHEIQQSQSKKIKIKTKINRTKKDYLYNSQYFEYHDLVFSSVVRRLLYASSCGLVD